MQHVTRNETEKLANNPISFAMMMDDYQIESVIVAFVSVLLKEKQTRGGKNKKSNT